MIDTDEFVMVNSESLVNDPITIATAYQKMRALCISMRSEIEIDIIIHNQHILPRFCLIFFSSCPRYSFLILCSNLGLYSMIFSSIDLPCIAASVYSSELCKRLRAFLSACPPLGPVSHVTDLLSASADFERDLHSWAIP